MKNIVMAVLGAMLCCTPLMAEEISTKHYDTLDKNQDGILDKQEFMDGKVEVNRKKAVKLFPDMRDLENQNDVKVKESAFDAMDKNHDGLLSTDEWRQVAPNIMEIRF